MKAHKAQLIESAHDISDGGMLIALSESLIGTDLGAEVEIDQLGDLDLNSKLFSESHSRFIISIKPGNREKLENIFGDKAHYLGKVTSNPSLIVFDKQREIINAPVKELENNWKKEF